MHKNMQTPVASENWVYENGLDSKHQSNLLGLFLWLSGEEPAHFRRPGFHPSLGRSLVRKGPSILAEIL